MAKFKVGDVVKVHTSASDDVPRKKALVGSIGKILKPSKMGSNQFKVVHRWVLDIDPGVWFEEWQLTFVSPSAEDLQQGIRQRDYEIARLKADLADMDRKVQRSNQAVLDVRKLMMSTIGTLDSLRN